MPSTTVNFLLETKYGTAGLSGYSATDSFKCVVLNYDAKVATLLGGGVNGKFKQPTEDKEYIFLENKLTTYLTITVMFAEHLIHGKGSFYTPLVLEGGVYQPSQKSSSYYRIQGFHPITKKLECSLSLIPQNWQELK